MPFQFAQFIKQLIQWLQMLFGPVAAAQDGAELGEVEPEPYTLPPVYADRPPPINGQRYSWIIDPGHGPETVDKQSPELPDGRQFIEAIGNRLITRYLVQLLREDGIDVHVTNIPELPGDSLRERKDRVNGKKTKRPKILVSIHCNAGPVTDPRTDWTSANGIETYHYPGSVAGKEIAEIVQSNLVSGLNRRDRGVKSARFYVLSQTECPAILGETLFYNNPVEVLMLLDPAFCARIAEAYANAIRQIEVDGLRSYPIENREA